MIPELKTKVNMIFADPPYHLSTKNGFTVHAGKRVPVYKGEWDEPSTLQQQLQFHMDWITVCRDILEPNGTIWISGTYHSIYLCGYALQKLGFDIINDICWYKPNAPPNLSCRYFTHSHETLIWARKNGKHTFNYEYTKYGKFPEDRLKNPNKQMRSVWSIPTTPKREKKMGKHPTQKPLALLERIILASTEKNDLILDPFTGSSTTGIAAYQHGRRFIGIDKEKEYLEISKRRFRGYQKQSTLNHF
ncbi:MAG: site-specific DNA-methyltransferase [Thermoplasmata archaeon]